MTGLRIPPEAEPEASAADESTAREGFDDAERAAPAARRADGPAARRHGLAAVGLADPHVDAHRAGAAVPAGGREHTGVAAAAGGDQPRRGVAVLRLAPAAGQHPGPPFAVQRVRRAVVRRDLPAAVRVAAGVRAAPDAAAGGVRAAAAAEGAAPPGQAPVRGQLHHGARARGGAAGGRQGAVGPAVPGAHRPGLGGRGKGLPAGSGQPALPHRAARLPGVDRARRAVRLPGRPAAGGRDLVLQHRDRAGRVSPGPPGVPGRPAAVHGDAGPLQRLVRDLGPAHRAAVVVQRGDPLLGHPAGPGAQLHADRQPPADRGRRPGLPDRPRLRPGVPGHRRHRARGLRRGRPVHPGRDLRPHLGGRDQGSGRAIPSSSASSGCSCRPPWTWAGGWRRRSPRRCARW